MKRLIDSSWPRYAVRCTCNKLLINWNEITNGPVAKECAVL